MKPPAALRAILRPSPGLAPALLSLAAGAALLPLLAVADRAAGVLLRILAPRAGEAALLAAPVLVEEVGKFLAILALGAVARDRREGLSRGAVAVAVFAALENCLYFYAFPGADIFARLVWSMPVHLVSALAVALALAPGRGGGLPSLAARSAAALGFSLLWHLGFNLAASRGPGALAVAAGGLLNGLALALLARPFLKSVVLGGINDGKRKNGTGR